MKEKFFRQGERKEIPFCHIFISPLIKSRGEKEKSQLEYLIKSPDEEEA
jgi:hypothetical protein